MAQSDDLKRDATQQLYAHARQRIPGGTHLLSKRPELFAPGLWPAYFRRAKGCEVWDLDGRRYIDMSHNAVGACLLGYAHPAVNQAVAACLEKGACSTLNPPEEVELADRLCAIHPWAERVRLARAGGEACAIAVRIARATTDRQVVAICGYHGWHDWYLAANLGEDDALRGHLLPGLEPQGVPTALRGTTVTFPHGDLDAFQAVLDKHGKRLAAVIMEPCRYQDPPPGFLEAVRDGAHKAGALLLFDEVTIGWRRTLGGVHLRLGMAPDMAIFAKALGNGHPIGAVIGTAAAMAGAETSFISSSCWTERVGPVAALATLDTMAQVDVPGHVASIGLQVQSLWREESEAVGLPVQVPDCFPCLARFVFEHAEANALRTLFTQRMLARGYLATAAFTPTLAHTEDVVAAYGEAVREVFKELAEGIEKNDINERLAGPPAHEGFRRLL